MNKKLKGSPVVIALRMEKSMITDLKRLGKIEKKGRADLIRLAVTKYVEENPEKFTK